MQSDPATEIWQKVIESNRAWTGGKPREVASIYHPNVVMMAPGFAVRVEGRDAIVESYVEYCDSARTLEFREKDPRVEVFGDTAVVTYGFQVRYEIGGNVHDEIGNEILVFGRFDGNWLAVWRTQVPTVEAALQQAAPSDE